MSADEYLDRLRERTAELAPTDDEHGDAHYHLTRAMALALERVAEAYDPDGDLLPGEPLLSVADCPDWALPWLAQTLGVFLPAGITADQQRALIGGLGAWQRGTPAAILASAKALLSDTKTVFFRERDPTAADPPYSLEVVTLDRETPATDRAYTNLVTNPSSEVALACGVVTARTSSPINLITNPSFETGLAAWSARAQANDVLTNLVPNPSFETNLTNWNVSGGGAVARDSTWAKNGTYSARLTGSGTDVRFNMDTTVIPCVPGETFSAAAEVNVIDAPGTDTRLRIEFFTSGGGFISGGGMVQDGIKVGTGTGRISARAGLAPATAAFVRMLVQCTSPSAETVDVHIDAAILTKTALVPDYHDGSTVGCAWTGTAHASTSTRNSFSVTDEVPARNGSQCVRLMRDLDGAGASGIYISLATASRVAVAAGQYLVLRASTRAKTTPRGFHLFVAYYDSGGVAIAGQNVTGTDSMNSTEAWVDSTLIAGPAPANAASADIRVETGAIPEGEVHYIDSVLAYTKNADPAGLVFPYFDGSIFGFRWNGTAHASTSDPAPQGTARTTDWAAVGSASTRATSTRDDGTTIAVVTENGVSQGTTGRFPVDPTHYYAYRLRTRIRPTTWVGAINSLQMMAHYYAAAGGGSSLGSNQGAVLVGITPGDEYDLYVIGKPPAGAAWVALRTSMGMFVGLKVLDVDVDALAMFDLGIGWTGPTGNATRPEDVPAYVDGTLPGCAWNGAAHASTSTRAPTSALVRDVLLAQKPGGLVLNYHSVPGYDWTQVVVERATWDVVKTTYSTWGRLVLNQPG